MTSRAATRQTTAWSTPWQWSDDVLTFARSNGVEDCLDPFLEATRQLFPTALSLRVFPEQEADISGLTYYVFELRVPAADVPDYPKACHDWTEALLASSTLPRMVPFCLDLSPVEA
jgi:hypothetical protein